MFGTSRGTRGSGARATRVRTYTIITIIRTHARPSPCAGALYAAAASRRAHRASEWSAQPLRISFGKPLTQAPFLQRSSNSTAVSVMMRPPDLTQPALEGAAVRFVTLALEGFFGGHIPAIAVGKFGMIVTSNGDRSFISSPNATKSSAGLVEMATVSPIDMAPISTRHCVSPRSINTNFSGPYLLIANCRRRDVPSTAVVFAKLGVFRMTGPESPSPRTQLESRICLYGPCLQRRPRRRRYLLPELPCIRDLVRRQSGLWIDPHRVPARACQERGRYVGGELSSHHVTSPPEEVPMEVVHARGVVVTREAHQACDGRSVRFLEEDVTHVLVHRSLRRVVPGRGRWRQAFPGTPPCARLCR